MGHYATLPRSLPQRNNTSAAGAQTLSRGLDVVEAVAAGDASLAQLAVRLALSRSTLHRLASALVDRGYLAFYRHAGYSLGPKLLELGFLAQRKVDLVQVARAHIEALAELTEDTVHLGVLDRDTALYLDKVAGQRRVNLRSEIGERQPLSSTGLGKALMLDHPPDYWAKRFKAEQGAAAFRARYLPWRKRMERYVAAGRTFDLEENEDQVRCVAAPLRGPGGRIVGAISVASAAQYMDNARMANLDGIVRNTAAAIGRELGGTAAAPTVLALSSNP